MAITCITGIPRSGKSYYCVYLLYISFVYVAKVTKISKLKDKLFGNFSSKKLKKTYDIAYTNINQFDFSKSPKIKPFDYSVIYAHLVNLHSMYIAKKTDEELIIYAKANNLYNAVFIIDECQNYFDKDDLILTWWFTYHGHLHQDIMLITQNFDLIFKGYTKLGEFFYKAVAPSSRFFSSKFRYIQYNSYQCYQKDKIGDFHVPMLPEVYGMYVSGATNNSPSQVKKYLVYASVLLVITILLFFYFMHTLQPEKKPSQSTVSTSKNIVDTNKTNVKTDDSNTTKDELFKVICIAMRCNYNGIDFPKPLLNRLAFQYPNNFLWSFKNGSMLEFYLMLPSDAFDFLQKNDSNTSNKDDKNGAIKGLNPLPTLGSK